MAAKYFNIDNLFIRFGSLLGVSRIQDGVVGGLRSFAFDVLTTAGSYHVLRNVPPDTDSASVLKQVQALRGVPLGILFDSNPPTAYEVAGNREDAVIDITQVVVVPPLGSEAPPHSIHTLIIGFDGATMRVDFLNQAGAQTARDKLLKTLGAIC